MNSPCLQTDLIVFANLRWDQCFERIHHLVSRYSTYRRAFYIERPIYVEHNNPFLEQTRVNNTQVLKPHIPVRLSERTQLALIRLLINNFMNEERVISFNSWYCCPSAQAYTEHLKPEVLIYDGFTTQKTKEDYLEKRLIERADLILSPEASTTIDWDQEWLKISSLEKSALTMKSLNPLKLKSQHSQTSQTL